MKKMLALLLVGIMALGSLGVASFADELTDVEIDTADLTDEAVEEIVDDILGDVEDEEAAEEEIAKKYFHNRFTDEFRKLYNERKETRRLVDTISDKKVKIQALKECAINKGEYWKLERAEIVEKEVHILKKSIDHIRDRKANLWDTFRTQFRAGEYSKAEVTLKHIVAAKILINDYLKLVTNLLIKEINVLK